MSTTESTDEGGATLLPSAGWAAPPPLAPPPAPSQSWQVWTVPPGTGARGNGLAVAGMVLGITSILFCWWGVFSLAQVVLAVVFSGVGISRANRGAPNKGLAIAGLVCGLVGAALYLLVGIVSLGVGFLI